MIKSRAIETELVRHEDRLFPRFRYHVEQNKQVIQNDKNILLKEMYKCDSSKYVKGEKENNS